MEYVIGAVLGAVAGLALGLYFDKLRSGAAYKTRDEIIEQAKKEAENTKRELELADREELLKRREKMDRELNQEWEKLRDSERKVDEREIQLKERESNQKKQERMLESMQLKLTERTKAVEAKDKQLDRILKDEQEQLYKISSLTPDQAKGMLLDRLDRELKSETGALVLKHRNELKEICEKEAQEIIGMAVQRYASAHTSESTVATVDIPSDEMKGRIIGREGRTSGPSKKRPGPTSSSTIHRVS
ncbi:MAG: Rnase Y domain-containing protein [Planctomycetaceae bacterium]